jgi:AraC-like DNA-binding protein
MKTSYHTHPVERILPDLLNVRVYTVDRLEIGAAWNARDVLSSYWRLYMNNRDGAAVVMADETYELAADRIHFVPAWLPFSCRCYRPVLHRYAHFELLGLLGSVTRTVFHRPMTLPPRGELEVRIAAHFLPRADHAENPLATDCHLKSLVLAALGELLETLPPEDLARCEMSLRAQSVFEPALTYIDQNLDSSIANSTLARLCSLSADHFIRRFREEIGQTPAQYVIEKRLAAASRLLLHTPSSIETIAAQTGFANRHYFSRVFARHLGLAPGQYRRAKHA